MQKLDSEGIPYVPSGWGFTRYFRWKGIGNYPHVLKGPEQYLVIWHTVDFCPRYNNLYVHHEGSGGTGIDPDSKVLVTVELDGFVETMELKSIL